MRGQDRPVELVDVFAEEPACESGDGTDATGAGAGMPRWSWLVAAAAMALVGGVVIQGWARSGTAAPARPIAPSAVASSPDTARVAAPAESVLELGHRLLDVPAGWELFGLGPGVVIRMQLALGRVTSTPLPGDPAATPAALLALPGRVVVRPVNYGMSYVVPDGAVATRLSGRLGESGPAVPGPRPGQVWVRTSSASQDATRMTLIGLDGRAVGAPVDIPGDGYLSGDGTGHIIYTTRIDDEYYLTAPGRWQLRTSGQLLAAGANEVVTIERDAAGRYWTVLTDEPSGRRHVWPSPGYAVDPVLGSVAPDGRTAAVLTSGSSATSVRLLDLSTGVRRGPGIALAGDAESLAWSPDGRWLFAATRTGQVVAIDARTAAVHRLDVSLPPLTQLVLRPTR